MRMNRTVALVVGGLVLATSVGAQEQVETNTKKAATREPTFTDVTDAMLKNARSNGRTGRSMAATTPISATRRSRRSRPRTSARSDAWMYQTGISRLGSFETSPTVVDGVMYLTTPYNTAMAVDARTGQQIWRYEHKPSITAPIYCCGPNNRGVAISGNSVLHGTLDARLVALDSKTRRGEVGCRGRRSRGWLQHDAHTAHRRQLRDRRGAPGAEYGIRGFVKAYNKDDGKLLWTFYTLPDKGWEGNFAEKTGEGEDLKRDIAAEKAAMAQYGDAWKRGGGSVWMTPRTIRYRTTFSSRSATRRLISTAPFVRATTSIRNRSSRSMRARASTSGTTSKCRTTCGTSTQRVRRSLSS